MANLNGHEAGNGGNRQEEPETTAPIFYSTGQMCAVKSVDNLAGESPAWVKVSRQPNIEFHV